MHMAVVELLEADAERGRDGAVALLRIADIECGRPLGRETPSPPVDRLIRGAVLHIRSEDGVHELEQQRPFPGPATRDVSACRSGST